MSQEDSQNQAESLNAGTYGAAIEQTGSVEPDADDIGLESPELANGAMPEETPKRKAGAPLGNQNAFTSGNTWIKRARLPRNRTPSGARVGKRFARSLIEDLGGYEVLSTSQLQLIDHCARDRGVLHDCYLAREKIYALKPEARRNLGVIAKLDRIIAPIQQRLEGTLTRLGLEKRNKENEIAPWEVVEKKK